MNKDDNETLQNIIETTDKKTPSIEFIKKGPTLREIESDPELDARQNKLSSTITNKDTDWQPVQRQFTEHEGIVNLQQFLTTVSETATRAGNQDLAERAQAMQEGCVFIGESEMQEAIDHIAQQFRDEVQSGSNLLVYIGGNRSERYVALRIAEEFDALTDIIPHLKSRLHISDNPNRIARHAASSPEDTRIKVVDDFILSGKRLSGLTGEVLKELSTKGIPDKKIRYMTEAVVVAAPANLPSRIHGIDVGKISAYYSAQEIRTTDGKWAVQTGTSLAGSHCTTDYGYQTEIREYSEFLKEQNINADLPLLFSIDRPYENDSTAHYFVGYSDPELQQRWENVSSKYSLAEVAV